MYRRTGVAMMDYIRDLRAVKITAALSRWNFRIGKSDRGTVRRSLNSAMCKFQHLLTDLRHLPTLHRLLHFGSFLYRITPKLKKSQIKIEWSRIFSGFGWPCINFRPKQHCSGDEITKEKHDGVTTYDRCASLCIGTPGCKSFNWDHNEISSKCYLLSSGWVSN